MGGMAWCDVEQTVWAEYGLTNPINVLISPPEEGRILSYFKSR